MLTDFPAEKSVIEQTLVFVHQNDFPAEKSVIEQTLAFVH